VGGTRVPMPHQYYVYLRRVFFGVTEMKKENKNRNILKIITWVVLRESKRGNVLKNVTLRRIRATIVSVEKQ
jgi:hypothetical protein